MPTISGKYKFNSTLPQLAEGEYPVTFTSNGGTFAKFAVEGSNFYYLTASNNGVNAYLFGVNFWNSGEAYRDIDFGSTPQTISDTLYNYLVANAAKEETQTTFDLSTLNLAAGTYSITVKAEAEGYTTSDASNAINYTFTIPIPTDSILFAGETSDFTLKATNKTWDGTVEYSTDKNTWSTWDGSEISSANKKLYLRGKNNTTFYTSNGAEFVLSANAGCYGNINTLLDYENPPIAVGKNCYRSMFQGCKLTSAPELPATTLADYCYYQMFYGCTKLVSAPALPATTLANSCYQSMFSNCKSLTSAPELPATTLTVLCYAGMFYGCTKLVSAPALPATTAVLWCYQQMFQGCTSLTTAPALPATTLGQECYKSMFQGCTSLKVSETQTEEYATAWRIPSTGEITSEEYNWNTNMLTNTGGTFTANPSINTTYYIAG